MAFNISSFKSEGLVLGGARPSLFEIELASWPGSGTEAPKQLKLLAKASSLPPSAIDSIDVGYFGRKIKVVGDRTYPNWSVTIMNDESFMLRQSFEVWHNLLNTAVTNLQNTGTQLGSFSSVAGGAIDSSGYKIDLAVKQFSKLGGEAIREYTLYGAFPVAIDAIAVDWDATNQIEQFNVEFAYDYWIAGATASGSNDSEQETTLTPRSQ